MAVSTVGVADAASPDKYLHTWQRTISGTAREDQVVQFGEPVYPTYSAIAYNISVANSDSHALQVMGDGTNYSRLLRVHIQPLTFATGGGIIFSIVRLSSAGTGGSAVTAEAYDSADTYAGGAMTLPSSKGTEGAVLRTGWLAIPATAPSVPDRYIWEPPARAKPIVFGTATSSGIALKVVTGLASATVLVNFEFITTTFL